MGIREMIRSAPGKGSILARLIYINIGVFLIITAGSITGYLVNNQELAEKILNIFAVPSSLRSLALRPWSVITYMFTHRDVLHILFNMLWLYWFGVIFLEYLDRRKLVAVYLLGGIAGAFFFIASFNIFPVFDNVVNEAVAIGASASVMAIVAATAIYVPDYQVVLFLFGRLKIKYIAIAIFIFTSVMDFSVNSGGKLAHMGGALLGFLYIVNLRRGRDIGNWANKLIDFFVTLFKPKKKIRVTYRKPSTDYDYLKEKSERQEKINKILDKISKGGYDSLTREEKDFLFRESQKKN